MTLSKRIQEIFKRAPFIQELGVELVTLEIGECHTKLMIQPQHLQQNDFVHAGVVMTLADHTAGAAGESTLPEGQHVLTTEIKVHLMRPALGPELKCHAEVIRTGKNIVVVKATVTGIHHGKEKVLALAHVTLAAISV